MWWSSPGTGVTHTDVWYVLSPQDGTHVRPLPEVGLIKAGSLVTRSSFLDLRLDQLTLRLFSLIPSLFLFPHWMEAGISGEKQASSLIAFSSLSMEQSSFVRGSLSTTGGESRGREEFG